MILAPELLHRGTDRVRVNNTLHLAPIAHQRRAGDTGTVQDVEPFNGSHIVLVAFTDGAELLYPEELDLLT